MALYMRSFTTEILIFLFFLSFINATPEEDHVKHFCKNKQNFPPANICIKAMIEHWVNDQVPESGPFREYYETFLPKMNRGDLKTHEKYCLEHKKDYENCKSALTAFGNSVETALKYALYDTTMELCSENKFTLLYIIRIISTVSKGGVNQPWGFCKRNCFPEQDEINWLPYLEE